MRFSPLSGTPGEEKGKGFGRLSPRKKHKRLDAICEKEYSRNHCDLNEGIGKVGARNGGGEDDVEIRRSSRVRRAPDLLDVSHPPPKKRKRVGMNGAGSSSGQKAHSSPDLESPESWKSRLRSRGRGSSLRVKEESPKGKRKLFLDLDGESDEEEVHEDDLGSEKDEPKLGNYTVVKSQRPGRIKATNGPRVEKVIVLDETEEEGGEESGVAVNSGNEIKSQLDNHLAESTESGEKHLDDCVNGDTTEAVGYTQDAECVEKVVELEVPDIGHQSDVLEIVAPSEGEPDFVEVKQTEKQVDLGRNPSSATNVASLDHGAEGDRNDEKEAELDEQTRVEANGAKVDKPKYAPRDAHAKPRIKEGRRCGLCGGGIDGKPPKPLAHDTVESGNDVYSGSSGSEEPNYDIWDGFGDEPGWLGRLLGPINDRFGIAGTWVHQHCAVWSPEVYFAGLGCLKNVRAALCRGRSLKCTRCARPGATIGCRVDRCPRTYHLPCARAIGCIFDHRKFLIACTDHRHIFQPHGVQNLARIKKVRAKKMKLELRKHTNEASRKDIEAEEKWFENCGEDEEFLKRESKRLHRDLARIAPVYIGGKDTEEGKLFQGWESVAGLQNVIQCMKEVVILPLLYPEFFDNMGLTPPRGILLHGHPGTGKTLVVRALIGACARGDRRIAYFARKGADCLGKYVGDAERQLRLLFQVAEKSQPSIIFFDEIDGLAPCRSRRQDQTHSSVVSTLLALMDGLKSRGSVIVIGATNRPDAIDPALRRPGRFDREIYFPLPSINDRAAILSLHTQRWPKPVSGSLLQWIAGKTAGFAGADLQALCSQAAVMGLQRNFPLQETLSAAEKRGSSIKLLPLPIFAVEDRDWLEALSQSPPPCSRREAGIAANEVSSSSLPFYLIPCLLKPLATLLVSLYLEERISLPAPLSKAAATIKNVMVSTLEKRKLPSYEWWSFLEDFLREADIAEAIGRDLLDSGFLIGDDSATTNDFGDDSQTKFESCLKHNGETGRKHTSFSHRSKSGFRVLIAGSQGSGQRHLASCLVHCFVGNVEVQKIDLATISQEGHGDIVLGITQILMKCAGVSSCMLYMPRLDLWAVETPQQFAGETNFLSNADKFPRKGKSNIGHDHLLAERENTYGQPKCRPEEKAKERELTHRISSTWSLFLEQIESISVSTSLTILATSEIPYPRLPTEIRQFFKKNVSNFSQPNFVEHTIPWFFVQVDEDFDHDLVVDLSVAKLARDVVRQLVQMIHHRSHTDKTSSKCTTSDFIAECNEEHAVKNIVKPNDRKGKGRSNLHLAISSLGYQILRYPHFAELCWFTSKLKEGPIAEVTGPWRGWPFNSCVIRPQENGNFKSKEKPGVVRGLVAVGLSAYKGVYTSLREVSSEIRKVLELLVRQINEKVQSGKDRYQYVRLLSQVAYLEDKVDSWVFTLQSLELDASAAVDNFNITASHDAPSKHSNVSEVLDENRQGLVDENGDLNKEDEDGTCPNPEVVASAYDGSLPGVDNFMPEMPVDFTEGSEQVVGNLLNEQNGSHHEGSVTEDNGRNMLMDGDSGILEHPNESVPTDSAAVAENGLDLGESGDNKCSDNVRASTMNVKDGNYPASEATQTVNLCLYRCCSECLDALHDIVRKSLHQRESGKNLLTVNDVHALVMSLSVDLVTSVRRMYDSSNLARPSGGETCRGENGIRSCLCCDSRNRIDFPVECACHSKSGHGIRQPDSFRHRFRIAADTKFVFRDGVLIGHNPQEDASFHCRFEKLCLCPGIESIRSAGRSSS